MESQSQNPEFRIDPENFHPCMYDNTYKSKFLSHNCLDDKLYLHVQGCQQNVRLAFSCKLPALTLKAPITTATDDNFATSSLILETNKV